MDDGVKGWIFTCICITIIAVTVAGCITYYYLEHDRYVERMTDKGISPVILECTESSWSSVSSYAMCAEILKNNHLTKDQAEKLIRSMEK